MKILRFPDATSTKLAASLLQICTIGATDVGSVFAILRYLLMLVGHVPQAADLNALNDYLRRCCEEDRQRQNSGSKL